MNISCRAWAVLVVGLALGLCCCSGALAFGNMGVSLGDRVWLDSNGNGLQDSDEQGIQGVTITLTDQSGVVVVLASGASNPRATISRSTIPVESGYYVYAGVKAGTQYTVTLTGLQSARLDDGTPVPAHLLRTNFGKISNIISETETSATLVMPSTSKFDVDFGFKPAPTYTIGDRVWNDLNGSGGADDGSEPGLDGVTVQLLQDGQEIATTTTATVNGVSGWYNFTGLVAGTYTVKVLGPVTGDCTYDLSAPFDGEATVQLVDADILTVDFSYHTVLKGSIGDFVWLDTDGDGVQDADETGIAGVTVELYQNNTLLATTTTDASGLYLFSDLLAGSYTVKVLADTLPAGLTQTYDLDGVGTANQANASLAEGENRRDVDFGYTLVPPDTRPFTTYTQGGWGGNGAAKTLLHAHFADVYPNGLVMGSNQTLTFKTAQAVSNFLPTGGSACILWRRSYVNPTCRTEAGVFAGQVLAMRLSVDFSAAGCTRGGLASTTIAQGPYAGWKLGAFLDFCEQVLGGNSDGATYSIATLNEVATAINQSFDNGTSNTGYLK